MSDQTQPQPTKNCPKCGAALSAGVIAGHLCPRCLIGMGMKDENDRSLNSSSNMRQSFEPPTASEIDAAFPDLEVIELAGFGGMGAVYKAHQTDLRRDVALKILPPEVASNPDFAFRFEREAQTLASLNHSNIVQIYHVGRTDQYCYFLMEYVDGVNLRQAIRTGKLAPEEALSIVPQICSALQYAHDQGVVHRDIKPENILLDESGRVKVTDFGLAKMVDLNLEASLTGTRQVMGTAHYMAPEQIQETRTVDHRADIYSLGVVFYEMLTGQLPLGRFSLPSESSEVDPRIDNVVMRSLENEPDRRYQAASEIKSDIAAVGEAGFAAVASQFKNADATHQNENAPTQAFQNVASPPIKNLRGDAIRKVHVPATFLLVIGMIGVTFSVLLLFGLTLMLGASVATNIPSNRPSDRHEILSAQVLESTTGSFATNFVGSLSLMLASTLQETHSTDATAAQPTVRADIATRWVILVPAFFIISLPVYIMMVIAGLRMKQLRSYGFVVFVAILAILPMNPLLFFFSLIAGIWSLIVLNDANVRRAFDEENVADLL